MGAAQRTDRLAESAPELVHILRRPIGQRGIGPVPDMLSRVEFRRIGGEGVGMDPRLIGQIRLDLAARMDRPAIPEQHHRASEMAQQGLKEGPDIQAVKGPVGSQAEIECQVAVLGRDRKGADGRELIALEPMVERRRVPLRGPGPFDGRGEREPALVEEDEMGAQSFSLFL